MLELPKMPYIRLGITLVNILHFKAMKIKRLFLTPFLVLLFYALHAQTYSQLLYLDEPDSTQSSLPRLNLHNCFPVGNNDEVIVRAFKASVDYVYLCKLNADGDIVWSKRLKYTEDDKSIYSTYSGTVNENGELFLPILSWTTSNGSMDSSERIIKLDADGNLLWATSIEGLDIYDIKEIGGQIYVTGIYSGGIGGYCIFQFDENGGFQSGKVIAYPSWVGTYGWGRGTVYRNGILQMFNAFEEDDGTGPNPGNGSAIFTSYNIFSDQLLNFYTTDIQAANSICGVRAQVFDDDNNRYLSLNYEGKNILAKYDDENNLLWSNDIGICGDLVLIDNEICLIDSFFEEDDKTFFRFDKESGDFISAQYHLGHLFNGIVNSTKVSENGYVSMLNISYDSTALDEVVEGMYPWGVVRLDAKGIIEDCSSATICEYDINPAAAPEFVPLQNFTIEDILNVNQEYVDLVIEDIPIISVPFCTPIPSNISADFTFDDPACPEDTVVFTPTAIHALPTTSLWAAEQSSSSTSTLDTAFFQFQTSGMHEVQHVLTTAGCKDTVTQTVEVLTQPIFELGDDTEICEGDSLLLESGLSPNEVALLWQDSSVNSNYLVNETGTYILQATNTLGCTATDSIFINTVSNPAFSLGQDVTICERESATLVPVPVPASPQFDWNTGAMSDRLAITDAGTYSLTITDQETGCHAIDSIDLVVQTSPLFTYTPRDSVYCAGVGLRLEAKPLATSNLEFNWLDGDSGPFFDVPSAGIYQLVAFDGFCRDTLQITVPNGLCKANVYLPNAFSPNGDGRNDLFQAYGPDIEINSLQVYNRWGSLVFESKGSEAVWDGMIGGRKAETGTYLFVLEYKNILSLEQGNLSGEVMLIR